MEQGRGSVAFGSYAKLAAALNAILRVDVAQRSTLEGLGDIHAELASGYDAIILKVLDAPPLTAFTGCAWCWVWS